MIPRLLLLMLLLMMMVSFLEEEIPHPLKWQEEDQVQRGWDSRDATNLDREYKVWYLSDASHVLLLQSSTSTPVINTNRVPGNAQVKRRRSNRNYFTVLEICSTTTQVHFSSRSTVESNSSYFHISTTPITYWKVNIFNCQNILWNLSTGDSCSVAAQFFPFSTCYYGKRQFFFLQTPFIISYVAGHHCSQKYSRNFGFAFIAILPVLQIWHAAQMIIC